MKQFRVIGISSKNQLLVIDNQKQSFEYPLEGFKLSSHLSARPLL